MAISLFIAFYYVDNDECTSIITFVMAIGLGINFLLEFEGKMTFWMIAYVVLLMLYNPFFPIEMHESPDLWGAIHLIVGVMLIIKGFRASSRRRSSNKYDRYGHWH